MKQLADILKSRMRGSDTLARLGGDEFAMIFMGCTINKAESILDDIVIAIREFTFTHNEKSFSRVAVREVPVPKAASRSASVSA